MRIRGKFLPNLWLFILYVCFYSISAEAALDAYADEASYENGSYNDSLFLGCVSCSSKYLLSSFSNENQTLPTKETKSLLYKEFGSRNPCKAMLPVSKKNMPSLSAMMRHLNGDGSHRRIISSMTFEIPHNRIQDLDDHDCNIVMIESLPDGVFADPFELSHLVSKKVYQDVAIFGDTNLELPSALSNRSAVELYLSSSPGNLLETLEIRVSSEMPLHARYPPLDISGYSKVEIEPPNVAMLCKPKNLTQDCSSSLYMFNVPFKETLIWSIPCGNQDVSALVSGVTFIATLVSALVIVSVSIIHVFSGNHVKQS